MNALAFVSFVHDQRRAIGGGWRIPESTLLLIALAGGAPGAKAGQLRFRHKTRNQPFRTMLDAILLFQAAVLALLIVPGGRDAAAAAARALRVLL